MVMKMQHTYEEQQSNVDNMIRQVAILTVMIKEIQGNRARSELGEKVREEGMIEVEKEDPTEAESKSEALLEEAETDKIESDAEKMQTEEESITTSSGDDEPQKTQEEAHDEPTEKGEEVIEQTGELDYTLFYLQPEKVHAPNEKAVGSTTVVVNSEDESVRRPPRKIDKPARNYYQREGKPEQEENWSRGNAARVFYWIQSSPWQ